MNHYQIFVHYINPEQLCMLSLKKMGTMGTISTLTYAIIFMGKSEKLHIYPFFRNF